MLDPLLRDLRSAVRSFAARPGWTAAAILCLAIATGANTAAFTLVNGLLLRPLPFDHPDQLVNVALREATRTSTRPFSLCEYRELAGQPGLASQLFARTFFPLSLATHDGARMAQAELVSGSYFEALRLRPFLGHFFDGSDDRAGSAPVAVLSHRLWLRRFRADAAVIGQSVRINGRSVVIAGIAPPNFGGVMQLIAADLWLPATIYPELAGSAEADTVPMFGVLARLSPELTTEEAAARLTSVAAALWPVAGAERTPVVMVTPSTGLGVPMAVEGALFTLSGFIYAVMTLLMAVACANVAALVLARGAGRSRDISVRLSLGATRQHIVRQLLTESAVLAAAGCAVGTLVALWLTQAFVARLTTPFEYVSYAIDIHPDARVFAYSAVMTTLAALLCGIAPIRHAGRVDVVDVLKQSAAQGHSRGSIRTLNAMVVMQLAVSTTLLVAAGLVVRTYVDAETADPGYETTGVIATTLDVNQIRLDRAAGIRLYQDVMQRLSALPGVAGVSVTRDLPFERGRTVTALADIEPGTNSLEPIIGTAKVVYPKSFQTLGVTIRHGRSFDEADPARPLVAVVNDSLAQRLWPEASPLGRTFRVNTRDGEPIEVVGVVPDVREGSLSDRPAFYQPFPHQYSPRMTVLMRVQGDPGRFFEDVRRTIRDVDQDLSIMELRTVDQLLDAIASQRRVPAAILSLVGLLGLLLSAVGLYGVVTYGVRERTREFGIRLALGARPVDVRRLVLRRGFTIVATGLIVGGGAAAGFTRLIRSALFGIGALDPQTTAAVCGVLLATAFIALYVPARWASRVEPAQTLRGE